MEPQQEATGRRSAPKPAGGASGKKPSKMSGPKRKRQRRLRDFGDNLELISFVLERFREGLTATEIVKAYNSNPRFQGGPRMTREDPIWIVQHAARNDWWKFTVPHNLDYQDKIRNNPRWRRLQEVRVVQSFELAHIADKVARMLLRMIVARLDQKPSVHVGLAGGHTVREVVRRLADLMAKPGNGLLGSVHFHALAAGFDPHDPSTNPSVFVAFFDGKPIPARIEFTGLNAPATTTPKMFEELKVDNEDIVRALAAVREIDIFVTGGTSWHKHSVLKDRMPLEVCTILEEELVVGDLLWRPIGHNGPIEIETNRRAFTLVELSQLRDSIRSENKQVLVALSPCGLCGELKGPLARCILDAGIVTHMVIDSGSADQVVNGMP